MAQRRGWVRRAAALVGAELRDPKPTPAPPAAGHRAHITADHQMCCQKHDEEFERSCRRLEDTVRFISFR